MTAIVLDSCGRRRNVEGTGAARRWTLPGVTLSSEAVMYMTIRHYDVDRNRIDDVVHAVREDFLPIVSSIAGFLSYDVVVDGQNRVATVSRFETREAAEESSRQSAMFIDSRPWLAAAISNRQLVAGDVPVHQASDPQMFWMR